MSAKIRRRWHLWHCRHDRHRCVTSLPEGLKTTDVGGQKMVTGVCVNNDEHAGKVKLFPAAMVYGQMRCPDCGRQLYSSRGGHTGKEFGEIIELRTGGSRPYGHPPIPTP